MSFRDRVRRGLRGLPHYHVPFVPARVKLDANESAWGPPVEMLDELAAAVRTAALERYPDPQARRLRALVAEELGQAPDRLLFGNGSDELISLLCQTFAEPPEGRSAGTVVYPGPSFAVYRTAALAAGLAVEEAPLGARFEPDRAALEEVLGRTQANLLFLATPNNPTGTLWSRADVEALVAGHPETVVVVDEAYVAYSGAAHLDLVDPYPNCLIMRTYSKVGLAALRLGVLVGQADVVREVDKVRGPYNLGLLPQLAGELAIGRYRARLDEHLALVRSERARMFEMLGRLRGIEVFPSAANLLLVRVAEPAAVHAALLERSILVRNLDRPGPLRGCLRFTVGRPDENQALLEALADILELRD